MHCSWTTRGELPGLLFQSGFSHGLLDLGGGLHHLCLCLLLLTLDFSDSFSTLAPELKGFHVGAQHDITNVMDLTEGNRGPFAASFAPKAEHVGKLPIVVDLILVDVGQKE